MYNTLPAALTCPLAHIKDGVLADPADETGPGARLLLKHGTVVDPVRGVEAEEDVAVLGDTIVETGPDLPAEKGDLVLDCAGLLVFPGLVDMHLHLGDLFEVTTEPMRCAAADGVTTGLSPGAGNTFMAPALLGAEVDRGVPLNVGVYLGAANVLGTMLSREELVRLFRGELDEDVAMRKMTRNRITFRTAPLVMGIKDHMGHFLMPDESVDALFDITSRAGLLYMSHTQDPEHAARMAALSKGRPLHLAHITAAGCGPGGEEAFRSALRLCRQPNITGELVTSMLRGGRGCREGLRMEKKAQELAFEALADGAVDILVSDGQNDAAMKGFGDTRDDIPAILEAAGRGVPLLRAVAAMTANPCRLIARSTGNRWWTDRMGRLGRGALANVTVVSPPEKRAVYTLVNGRLAAFEGRALRGGFGAGRFVSRFGAVKKTGVGDRTIYTRPGVY